ncbi:hypothetical protein J2Y69_002220 [Microbacterium resistens]|uniref:Uncharacterized protein n=1 Tax=Microbacterium resistens TaxID=156977 RepID=A0ABU1SDC9_9MICO|nr:hypothetical protein [Microbacterium resistens]MDR6867616.1 hypothetical protein [Microbacterium resistens]
MRSIVPMEGNPWPHDMTITIDDSPHQLLELLWVREAWGLHPAGDLPPLLVDTPPRAGDPVERDVWEAAWPEVWADVVGHAGRLLDPSWLEDLGGTANGSRERSELLNRIVGPSWRGRFGDGAFGDGYRAWGDARSATLPERHPRSLAESPERRSLDALVPAWKAGLVKVVTIPCRGEHTRILGGSGLLVTDATRDDPGRYSAALRMFAQAQPASR